MKRSYGYTRPWEPSDEQYQPSNSMLARFMGCEVSAEYPDHILFDYGKNGSPATGGNRFIADSIMEYHKSWNWLMTVVAKLHDDYRWVYPVHRADIESALCAVDLKATYKAVCRAVQNILSDEG